MSPASGSATLVASKPAAGVADDDQHLAVSIAVHDALDLARGVALAPVADGVGEGFLQRQLDFHHPLFGPFLVHQHLHDAVGDGGNRARLGGNDHVELAGGTVGEEPTQFVDLVERLAKLVDERGLLRFGPVALGKRLLEIDQVGAELELRFSLPPQRVERLDLLGRQRARHAVDHAQRAERVALWRHERRASVEANAILRHDQGVIAERLVVEGVGHHEKIAVLDRVRAERDASRGFGDRDADPGLEPLPVGVDQADERNRRLADMRGEEREVVEGALRIRIEDAIPPQGRQPSCFVRFHDRWIPQRPVVNVRLHG